MARMIHLNRSGFTEVDNVRVLEHKSQLLANIYMTLINSFARHMLCFARPTETEYLNILIAGRFCQDPLSGIRHLTVPRMPLREDRRSKMPTLNLPRKDPPLLVPLLPARSSVQKDARRRRRRRRWNCS